MLQVVGQVPLRQFGGGGDGRRGAVAGGDGEEHRVVGRDLAQFLAQQERRLVEQRRELVDQVAADVAADGPGVVEAEQVLRQAADQEVRPRPVFQRPARMEPGRLQIAERLQVDLRGAPSEQGARLAEHFPFHEPEVRTAQQQHDVSRVLPLPVPAVLQRREQTGAGRRDPLEFVQGQDELGTRMGRRPLPGDGAQRLPPVAGAQLRQQRHVERAARLGQELAHLQPGRRLLPQVVHAGLAGQEPQDELALADPPPAVDRDQRRTRGLERPRQQTQLRGAPDELRHRRSMRRSRSFVKSCFVKSCLDKSCFKNLAPPGGWTNGARFAERRRAGDRRAGDERSAGSDPGSFRTSVAAGLPAASKKKQLHRGIIIYTWSRRRWRSTCGIHGLNDWRPSWQG